MCAGGDYEQSVRRKNGADRRALRLPFTDGNLAVYGKHERQLGVASRALRHEVEVPELRDVIAPELET
ncbi:MAG TPA: hypothetical protein VN971_09895, partial [Thermoanaerobaculia bacterium]|nr:hypothetical protein [Thermoanaerobaculia bacterium]